MELTHVRRALLGDPLAVEEVLNLAQVALHLLRVRGRPVACTPGLSVLRQDAVSVRLPCSTSPRPNIAAGAVV